MAQTEGADPGSQLGRFQGQEDVAQRAQEEAQGQDGMLLLPGEDGEQDDPRRLDRDIDRIGRGQSEIMEEIGQAEQGGQAQDDLGRTVPGKPLGQGCH